jgi:addiction module RelE/StbE family toxin
MIEVCYTPAFIRQYKKLPVLLREEVKEKLKLFKNKKNHQLLKAHKLKGRLKGRYSFAVNYSFRIVFQYLKPNQVVLFAVGDHSVYSL